MVVKIFDAPFHSIRNYIRHCLWLLSDGLKGRLWQCVWIVFAGFLGATTVAVTFILLLGYARFQISGRTVSFKGISLIVPPGPEGLFLYAGGALIMGLLSAYCIYWGQRGSLRVAEQYHFEAAVRAVGVMDASWALKRVEKLKFLTPKHDRRHVATIYTNYLCVSLKTLLDSVQPLIMFIFAFCSLLWVNLKASLAIFPLAIVYMVVVYKISKKSTLIQGDYVSRISQINPLLFEFYRTIEQTDSGRFNKDYIKNLLEEEGFKNVISPFYDRMLVPYKSALASQVFLTVSMVWLFVVFGLGLSSSKDWTAVITFLVALRFAGQSLKRVATLFVGLSRYYPSLKIFRQAVAEVEKCRPCSVNSSEIICGESLVINFPEKSFLIDDEGGSFRAEKGQPFILSWLPKKGSEILCPEVRESLIEALVATTDFARNEILIHGRPCPVPCMTYRDWALGGDNSPERAQLFDAFLCSFGFEDELKKLPKGLDTKCTLSLNKQMSKEFLYLIYSGYLLLEKKKIAIIDYKPLLELNSCFQNQFIDHVNFPFLGLYNNDLSSLSNMGEVIHSVSATTPIIFVDHTGPIGTCRLGAIEKHRNKLEELYPCTKVVSEEIGDGGLSLDDETFL